MAFTPIKLTGETHKFDAGNVALALKLDREPSERWTAEFDGFSWEMVVGQFAAFPKVNEDTIVVPVLPNDQLYRELFKRIDEAIDRTNETQAHIGEPDPSNPEKLFRDWFEDRG